MSRLHSLFYISKLPFINRIHLVSGKGMLIREWNTGHTNEIITLMLFLPFSEKHESWYNDLP